jgi:hypothetical protein
MPRVEVTSATVSHIWDDNSSSDVKISKMTSNDTGFAVLVNEGQDTICLRPESWPEIRDQIDAMMDQIAQELK